MVRSLRFPSAVLVLCALLSPSASPARTWMVLPDGSGDAPTLQAAADSTSPGDTVAVAPGNYVGAVAFLTPDVTLIGTGAPGAATVDAGGSTLCVGAAAGMLIDGLRFVGTSGGAYGFEGAAVACNYVSIEIRNCAFENAHAAVETFGSVTLTDCEIRNGFGILWRGFGVQNPLLDVERCLFESNRPGAHYGEASILQAGCEGPCSPSAELVVRDCVFRDNQGSLSEPGTPIIGYDAFPFEDLTITVENNLFLRNGGPALGWNPLGVVRAQRAGPYPVVITFRNNTVARSTDFSLGATGDWRGTLDPGTYDANVVTGGASGIVLPADLTGFTVTCNDSWANGQSWVGHDLTGVDGNLSVAPKYCDPKGDDFTLASNSPLLPANNACGVTIGAFGQGCGPISVESLSWGDIKGRYR